MIYKAFDKDFGTGQFLAIFLFSAPTVALSGLFIFDWMINHWL